MMVEEYPYQKGHSMRSIELMEGVKIILTGIVPVPPTMGYSYFGNKSMNYFPYFETPLLSYHKFL